METKSYPRQQSLALRSGSRQRNVVIQRSPVAGFRHHQAPLVWAALDPRVPVTMEREPFNSHDADAVALFWKGRKLGYLPRGENFVVARLLDGNRRLSARIRLLSPKAKRNLKIHVEVLLH